MFDLFRKNLAFPSGPKAHRAYAIGDIHGRLDLLDQLLEQVERDNAARSRAETHLVFLGDLIDRGPSSCQVVERLRTYRPRGMSTVFLIGNHEEVLLRLLGGEKGLWTSWLQFGGAECLRSYGVDVEKVAREEEAGALRQIATAIPSEHAEFLRSFADTFRFGDYLFVHAGIRPGVELDAQKAIDLRWIRHPFLEDESDHGMTVVHGHTISPAIEERPNRIGIDTGAYRTGVLTALGIEGAERWYINTAVEPSCADGVTID